MTDPRKLLLIDDDSLVAQLIGMMVEKFTGCRYTLDHANDYAPGLEKLLAGGYDLCLLDYQLGTGDGLQLLAEAKAKQCYTPIILLTGDTREETDLAAMEGGAADFIMKRDLKPDTLERSIDYAIKMAEAHAKLRRKAKLEETGQI